MSTDSQRWALIQQRLFHANLLEFGDACLFDGASQPLGRLAMCALHGCFMSGVADGMAPDHVTLPARMEALTAFAEAYRDGLI